MSMLNVWMRKTVKLSGVCGEVLKRYPQLHALVNNAGVGFGPPGGARQVSAEGIELRFAVNHLAGTCWPGGRPIGWSVLPRAYRAGRLDQPAGS